MEEYMLLISYINKERSNKVSELKDNEKDTKLLFDLRCFIEKYSKDIRSVDLIELKSILSDIEINTGLVNSYINQINTIISCYDLVFNNDIPNEGLKKKMLDDYNFIGRLLVNYYKIRKSIYEENKTSLNLEISNIDKFIGMISKEKFYVSKDNINEFIEFIISLNIPRSDVLKLIAKISENSIEYYLNKDKIVESKQENISNIEEMQEDIKHIKAVETKENIEFKNLLNKVRNIITSNIKFLNELGEYKEYLNSEKTDNSKLNKYGSIIYYLNNNDIESAKLTAYPDYLLERIQLTLALAELQDLLNYALEGNKSIGEENELSEIIEDSINKYEEIKKKYDEVISIKYEEEDSKPNELFKNSKNIMLLLKTSNGEFCIDKDIERYSNADEKDVIKRELNSVLSKFRDIPYIDSDGYSGIFSTYSGSSDTKQGKINELFYLDSTGKRRYDDLKSYRFRGSDNGRTCYIVINICKENREKLYQVYGNKELLKGGNVILFTDVICCDANHDDYSIFNTNINNNRMYINYLNEIFSNPNTDIEVLCKIINESMDKCFLYLNNGRNTERSI